MSRPENLTPLVKASKTYNNWQYHPDSKEYSYNPDLKYNNQYILRDNASKLIVGFVDQELARAIVPGDLDFIQNIGFDIDPSSVGTTIYRFRVTGLRYDPLSRTINTYVSRWYATYEECYREMKKLASFEYTKPFRYWRNTQAYSFEISDNQAHIYSTETVLPEGRKEKKFFIVVGMRYCGGHTFCIGDIVTLEAQDDKPEDTSAIKVMVGKQHVAYVSSDSCPILLEGRLDNKIGKCVGIYFKSCKFQLLEQ